MLRPAQDALIGFLPDGQAGEAGQFLQQELSASDAVVGWQPDDPGVASGAAVANAAAEQGGQDGDADAVAAVPADVDVDTHKQRLRLYIDGLQLVDVSTSSVWKYAFAHAPGRAILSVYSCAAQGGGSKLKAVCHKHRRCECWLKEVVSGGSRFRLLLEYVQWAVEGQHATEEQHRQSSVAMKRAHGMVV